jgi:uncharacterized protein (DUF885 family)
MQNRRQFLSRFAVLSVIAAAPRVALTAESSGEASRMYTLLDQAAAQALRTQPELATSLGLDKDELAWVKSQLSDLSLTALANAQAVNATQLKELRSIDRSQLSGMDAVNYDSMEFQLAITEEADRKFKYGMPGGGFPYVVSQLGGAYREVPDFLDTQHVIETKADADAYLARMGAFARQLDQESDLVRRDAGLGVIAPDFVVDKALAQLQSFLSATDESALLVTSIERRTRDKNISGDWSGNASALYGEKIRPALLRQYNLLQELRVKAMHEAGCWWLPEGDDYYATSVRKFTTAKISPVEIHKTGIELVASLGSEADRLMRRAGYKKGTVGQRFRAMTQDPKQVYPNTEAGKAELLGKLNEQVATIAAKLPKWFNQLPQAPLEIRRVPSAIELGAPGGYYSRPSIDGTRPGIYWINLRDTAEVPRWSLPTLTYHEGLPGHHLQLSLNNEAGALPLLRKAMSFSGYSEGWALYAEELALEMGMYEDDLLGHIGMLHDAMFRAVRLVVDSGMHAMRWSREEALKYYIDQIGDPEAAAVTEIERYCVMPGQACSYMVGKLTWLRGRERAKRALGRKFDIRQFHDAGLLAGGTPLTVLDRIIDDYIATAKRSS